MIWITGLPGAGKTTLARELASRLNNSMVLDSEKIRPLLWPEIGYTIDDRSKNTRRLGSLAQMIERQTTIRVIVAAISPYRDDREGIREDSKHFLLVHLYVPIKILHERRPGFQPMVYIDPDPSECLRFDTSITPVSEIAERVIESH